MRYRNELISSTELTAFLKNLTTEPGVYRMLDATQTVLYVGKASNLKNRVNSYFSSKQIGIKTRSLVSQITAIEVSVTRSETEALLLESNLIKSLKPKYNILMRDDKTYPYLLVSAHDYPRMEIMRSKKKPKSGLFFGPYPGVTSIKETVQLIQKIFKIRNCSDSYFNSRTRPCLQYQIKRCSAPCTAYISVEEYQRTVSDAVRFLQGKGLDIIQELEARMDLAVTTLAFEEAAKLRDQIKSLRQVQEQQGMIQLRGDADVIVAEVIPGFACVLCVTIREGQVLNVQSFFPQVPTQLIEDAEQSLWEQTMLAFISYYYLETPDRIPSLLITQYPLTEKAAIASVLGKLRGKVCHLQANPRGVKARWLDFALNNLEQTLAKRQASAQLMKTRYQALAAYLQIEQPITRMECFDISHTQGTQTVASNVVFDEEGPNRKAYRRFNIQNITPGDDYAAMEQALTRRFKKTTEGWTLPQILLIDGGKGQVAVAARVLEALDISGITLLGIAKGPKRKAGFEHLILADLQKEETLPEDSPALHLLQYIRDEAHRFAITLHRQKRQKAGFESSLESIDGIGHKRRQALLRRFGGIRALAKAPLEEILKVPGISVSLAEKIYAHFHD